MMAAQLDHRCEQHPDPFDCPDQLVYRTAAGDFGLIVHDGGSSFITISFCPWCGSALGTAEGVEGRVP
jgi:hypothetical protein